MSTVSSMSRSQIKNLSIGAGARQRRRDKHRAHHNKIFARVLDSALDSYRTSGRLEDYYDELFSFVSHGREATPLEQAVEIDDIRVISSKFSDNYKTFSKYSDSFDDISILTVNYSGCEFNLTKFSKYSGTDFIQRVSKCVVRHSPAPQIEESEYAPKSPERAESPSDTPLEDVQRFAVERSCIDPGHLPLLPESFVTPIRLHPQKKSVVIYAHDTIPGAVNFDDYIESLPLRTRRKKRVEDLVPRHGVVFVTSNYRRFKRFGRHHAAFALVRSPGIREYYGESEHDIRSTNDQLIKNKGFWLLSLNKMIYDVSICQDINCLHIHRGPFSGTTRLILNQSATNHDFQTRTMGVKSSSESDLRGIPPDAGF